MRKLMNIDVTDTLILEISNKFEVEISYELFEVKENLRIFYRVFILLIFIHVEELGQNF